MDYEQLKEMPRFYIAYSIKFFNEKNKEKILSYFNNFKKNDDILIEVLYEEEETYSLNIMFSDFLFCGFSCSDAITYLFAEDILRKIDCILKDNENNIKDISLNIECYDNILAKRYYMYTDIVDNAANIVHKIKPNIYFTVGKDGVYNIKELKKSCKKFLDIDIYKYNDLNDLLKELRVLKKEYMVNKIDNYKKIIIAKYCIIFVKKLISKKIDLQ